MERPLNWAVPTDDVPVALEGEVGGPGDDLRVECGTRRAPLEVQCKRALAGRTALAGAIGEMARKLREVPSTHEIVLVVGPGSSAEVRDVFAADVRNYRQNRRDSLHGITNAILADVPQAASVLSRLYVVGLDVDEESGTGAQLAIDGLRQALVDERRASETWSLLVRNGLRLAKHGRWERASIEAFVKSSGLALRPVGPDARWLEQIDYARSLHGSLRPRSGAGLLDHVTLAIQGQPTRPEVRRQLFAVRGACALMLGDLSAAREFFGRALEYVVKPTDGNGQPLSAETKPWCDAQCNYGLILYIHEEYDDAERVAREILALDSRHVCAWGLLARALDAKGVPLEAPPSDLADAPDFRDALAHNAARRGDWHAAVAARVPLLAAGHRAPLRISQHAQALLNAAIDLSLGSERRRVLEEVQRTADEAVRALESSELESDLAFALFVRGRAREELGLGMEALADYDRAAALAPREPNVVLRVVQTHRREGQLEAALAVLTDPVVESALVLRLNRAHLRAEMGRRDDALSDLTSLMEELPGVATATSAVLSIDAADLAVDLERLDLSERALNTVDAAGLLQSSPQARVVRARLAVARDDWEGAEREYRAAASLGNAAQAAEIIGEFAYTQSRAGRFAEALPAYVEAGAEDARHKLFKAYIASLVEAQRFDRIAGTMHEAERTARARGDALSGLPSVLLDAAIDIAWRREDYEEAARLLEARLAQALAAESPETTALLLNTGAAQRNAGNDERSATLVNLALERQGIEPADRMRAANLLVQLGAHERAIEMAFKAVRAMPSDRQMIANFINLVIAPDLRRASASELGEHEEADATEQAGAALAEDARPPVEELDDDEDIGADGREGVVAAECFVKVRTEDGQSFEYFVYREPPCDPRLDEYLETDAAVVDLIGKRVGDVVVRNRGTWNEVRLRVVRVLPAVVMVFRRYMRTFSARFPDEASYRSFKIGKSPTLESFAPVLAAAYQSSVQAEEAFRDYERLALPLGMLARALGRPLISVVHEAVSTRHRLLTEGPPYLDYAASLRGATEAATVVLTRPALEFVGRLGIWEALAGRFRLLAPRTMLDEWEREIAELETTTEQGRVSMREGVTGPRVSVMPAGATESLLRSSREMFERVRSASTVMLRPVTSLAKEDDTLRDRLGAASFDAVAIARAEDATLYADDLGLRAIAKENFGTASFATGALLELLRTEGRLPESRFESSVIRLIEWGHETLPIRGSTVAASLVGGASSSRGARRVLDLLADPQGPAIDAAVVAAGALRSIATADLATTSFADAAEAVVEALLRHREPKVVIPPFAWVLREALKLLPTQLDEVLAITKRVLDRQRIVRP